MIKLNEMTYRDSIKVGNRGGNVHYEKRSELADQRPFGKMPIKKQNKLLNKLWASRKGCESNCCLTHNTRWEPYVVNYANFTYNK